MALSQISSSPAERLAEATGQPVGASYTSAESGCDVYLTVDSDVMRPFVVAGPVFGTPIATFAHPGDAVWFADNYNGIIAAQVMTRVDLAERLAG